MKTIKYILYRLLWHIAPYLPNGKFIHLDIEINNNCNQSCLSCWHHEENPGFKIKTMSSADVFEYLEQAAQLKVKSVKFNLRGEPTLNNNLIDYVEHAKSLGFVDIMINTNGVKLDVKKMLELDKAGLTTCIISVDTLNQKKYMKLHGVGQYQFKTLVKNLFAIRRLKEDFKIKAKVILNFHINKVNEKDDFGRYKKELWPLKINIRNTQKRKGKNISLKQDKKKRKKTCPHIMRRLTITSNKTVYPCCVCYDEPLDIQLFGIDLETIWFSKKRQYLIENYRDRHYAESCKKCTSGDIWKN